MAVRNLDKINQIGNQKREEARVANDIKREKFNLIVNRIRSHRQDCIDAIDTIQHLSKNGLFSAFKEWNKSNPIWVSDGKIGIGYYDKVTEEERRKVTVNIGYIPATDDLYFAWGGYGMGECYKNVGDEYIFNNVWEKSHYKDGLEKFAVSLESWLKNFFAWVEQL